MVKVTDGRVEFKRSKSGRKLLRIKITAEVNGVRREYVITFGRYGEINVAEGRAYARADVPGGKEADAEKFSAFVKALTGRGPTIHRTRDSKIIECCRGHLEDFKRYAELTDAIVKWLEETR
jgi:hypothetical protein